MYKINHSKALLDLDALNLRGVSVHHNLMKEIDTFTPTEMIQQYLEFLRQSCTL